MKKLYLFLIVCLLSIPSLAVNFNITVTVYGNGSVSSAPAGINSCTSVGGTCTTAFTSGSTVVLTSTNLTGSVFTSWAFPGCGVTGTCSITLTDNALVSAIFTTIVPQLPQVWVNNNEGNNAFNYELVLGASSWVTGPPLTCTFSLPYAVTFTGLQSAINDIEACRTHLGSGAGTGIALDIPPGTYQSTTANGLVIPQTGAGLANVGSFLIFRSTDMSFLPMGRTVCSHGIQDNLSTSTDIGLDNPDCTGQNMYYKTLPAVGTTVSGLTQLSVNSITLNPITTSGQQVNLTNGFVPTGTTVSIDSGGNQENATAINCINNQTGMCALWTKNHAQGVSVTYNVGGFTLANGLVTNTSNYNDISHMWKVVALAGGTGNAVSFCNASASASPPTCASNFGPDHIVLQGMAATLSPGSKEAGFILQIAGSTIDTTVAQLSTHIHIQRSLLIGDWTSTLVGANQVTGGCQLEGIYISFMDSQISQIERPGAESHPCTVNSNSFKGVHNWFGAGSQGFFPGGYSSGNGPSLPIGFVPGQDWEIRRNMESYQFSWLSQSPITGGLNPNYPSTFSLVRKNAQENKDGARVLIRGNIFEDIDNSGAQSGVTQEMNPRNNSAGNGTFYLSTVHDFTIQNNIFRHACALTNITTSNAGPGGGVAFPPRNIWMNNNLFYDIEINNFNGACISTAGMQLNSGGGSWQGNVSQIDNYHEQIVAACNVDSGDCIGQITAVSVSGGTCGGSPTLTFPTPDLVGGNQARATVHCSGAAFQTPVITNHGSGYTAVPTVTLNCPSCTGSQTILATRNSSSSGIATDVGFQVFNFSAGDPVAITDCQNSAFNTVGSTLHTNTYIPSSVGPPASGPSAGWTGTFNAAAVTVTVPHAGTSGTNDNGGYCKVTTLQGAPYDIHYDHNTIISDSTHVINSSQAFDNSETDGPQYQVRNTIQNNLFTNGDIGSSAVGSGTTAQKFWFDSVNTLTMDHSAFTGQNPVSYTAYGINPIYPASSPLLYFPANSCLLGFNGIGSWLFGSCSSVPLNTTDYHFFKLNTASAYHAGQPNQASDGIDNGVNIGLLDSSQTENIAFGTGICPSACGSPGPYPDVPVANTPPTNLLVTPGVLFTLNILCKDRNNCE
jgi:hypothetical protein